jgi:hypothetical protein
MKPIYEVCVDWDALDWADDPDFSEEYDKVAGDVDADGINFIGWTRGKQSEEGNAPAATLEIRMKPGLCAKYSPFTTGILAGKVRPWLPVRVRVLFDGLYYPAYFGYIERITINPHPAIQSVTFYCTDGTDLLARQEVAQNAQSKTLMTDGDAVEKILDAAGWSKTKRLIDKDGGDDLLGYPATSAY